MRVVMFYHSLLSDWNHGNAHFLRGVASELAGRGHEVRVYEPRGGWSLDHLVTEHGLAPVEAFHRAYPGLTSRFHEPAEFDPDALLDGADLVLVHEWNAPQLVGRIGRHRREHGGYRLLFHDTHHRAVSEREAMARYELEDYDGVLAFGEVIRQIYLEAGWSRQAWTWHEAADVRVFHPLPDVERQHDLAWIGNWGDDERSAELHEFLLEPARALGLDGTVHGVRYPAAARQALADAGLDYRGWLANFEAPAVFARHRATVHVPRRPYVRMLPGIPTIRPFEALACGIPLVSAPWPDVEGLFEAGRDYLVAEDGAAMQRQLRALLSDADMAAELARHGRQTILARHTCAHRVDQLLQIVGSLQPAAVEEAAA
ncbi:MAG TPA: glycosyltransferase [Rhodanobacteraceae bacterium]|nr:glycosyltransferase [Rhodanobacteraceae bacterium]